MKPILVPILTLGVLLAATSCQREESESGESNEVGFSISAAIPRGITTYAPAGTGSHNGGAMLLDPAEYTLRYTLEVYDKDGKLAYDETRNAADGTFEGVTFDVRLLAKIYDFVFWADFVKKDGTALYNVEDLKNISYTDAVTGAQDLASDAADAYYGKEEIDLTQGNQASNVTLKRPFGKIRLIATDAMGGNNQQEEVPATVSIDFGDEVIPTAFNAFEGTVIDGATTKAGTVEFNAVKETTIINGIERKDVYLFGVDYFFESPAINSYAMEVEVTSNQGNVIGRRSLSSIPVEENKLTSVVGNFYTHEGRIEVVVNDAFDPDGEIVAVDKWDGQTEQPTIDNTTRAITVNSSKQLAGFAQLVNEGNSYSGYTVTLNADIDLNNLEWEPIGTSTHSFKGNFDGGNHTISNLRTSDPLKSNVGLFGFTQNGTIKNIHIHNAEIQGYLEVGTIAGTPYTTKYSNIRITGLIKIDGYAYVGGILGKNAYASLSDLTIDAEEGSYVRAESETYRSYVGGVIGFMGEGQQTVSNVVSNIDVYGTTCDVGGITGIAHYGNTFSNCSCTGNVTLENAQDDGDQLEIGGIAGVWYNKDGQSVTFTNCSFTGSLTTFLNGVDYSENVAESNKIVGKAYNSSSDAGQLIIDGVVQ